VTTGVFLSLAPDTIPAHYNAAGVIDRWGSKHEYLLFPAITALMGIFFAFVLRNEEKKGRKSNAKMVLVVGILVLIHFNAMWILFFVNALKATELAEGFVFGTKAMNLVLMASFIPLGNQMPKAQKNTLFGLRTKWSMADDLCWQKSQRFGGYLMMGTGALGVAVVSLVPEPWSVWVMLALILAMAVVATAGTYVIWKREQGR
jgi:uncharacterized membrane protein